MATILIKRYPNRKLYDTDAKRYITLDSIAGLIRDGNDVEVRDHETGEDLTGITLSQIIFESEKKNSGYLPSALLANLIRAGGDTFDYMRRSVQASMGAVRNLEAEIDSRIDGLVKRGELAEDEARKLRAELSSDRLAGLVDYNIIDNRIEAGLHRLNIPSRADVMRLQSQIQTLTSALDGLLESEDSEEPTDIAVGDEEASV
ncbi:MAG: pesticidal protein Cry15Aa [Anaerolineales bacterium]|nr:pesticidal protein Cry15Aa [Anaerolineae bacterium]MCB9143388.1 pesticidal protein Cry15Aa [Anaerolineales bacterium]